MKPVRIRILSSAKRDGVWDEATEYFANGKMAERGGKYYVIYDEGAESGLAGTRTTLKWDAERVIVLRSGTLEHRQEFRCGLIDNSLYRTAYIELPLVTTTSRLQTYFFGGAWCIELEYSLAQAGKPYGEMKILIDIEEEAHFGH